MEEFNEFEDFDEEGYLEFWEEYSMNMPCDNIGRCDHSCPRYFNECAGE